MSRNYTCSLGWVAAVGLLCTLFLAPEQSAACSCVCYYNNWGFVSDGGLIPSNSHGLLWWGEFEGSNSADHGLPVQIASTSGEPLPVEYELVSKYGTQSLWLFRPRGGFKIGKSYVFTTRRTCAFMFEGGWEQQVSVTISDQAAVSPAGPVALKVGKPIMDALAVAAGGSCSEGITAAQFPIKMDLPEAMGVFRDQLYFETIIDGARWDASASLCNPVVPGTSWRGKGVDLLFIACTPFSSQGLAAGRHTVEMRASLPGTDFLAVTSKVEVELRCQREPYNPVDEGFAIRSVDLQAYCARRSFTGIRNLDGTGYGWRCTPGDANIDVNQACAEQYDSDFAAQLLSKPPGGPNDWRCRRMYH